MTGGRVKCIQKYIGNETFMLTYGDGVCDVNIDEFLKFHKSHGKIATITSIIQKQQKGVLELTKLEEVRSFREKKNGDGAPINAGFINKIDKTKLTKQNIVDIIQVLIL